jgi:hypothetical protein
MGTVDQFKCEQPCNNCPYRKDAPLRHWAVEEFINLIATEKSQFGAVFGCHKNNGSVCVGWLMKQDERYFPSIALRMSLSKHKITRDYLDKLNSPSPLFDTVEEMVKANYPEYKF